ncbi:MAG TPA: chorismate mutase [Candidatus Saccharimonadales bacterium]|nr:chorismate mutase [Candidatus Saccharimonadales bacterium]
MNDKLFDLRKEIDELDRELLKVISKRIKKVKEVGVIKKSANSNIFDESRMKQVVANWKEFAKQENLSEEVIEKIYKIIHDYSLEIEKNIK